MQDTKQLLTKSLNEIKRLKAANKQLEQSRKEPIAIVGVGCRYPGGIGSLEQLWEALDEGRDCITRMDDQRWPMHHFLTDDQYKKGGIYSDAMGLLNGIDRFDPAQFSLTHDEAKHIDPQHRLLMELVWETIEDAGYAVDSFAGSRTGVYVGLMSDDYGQLQGPLEAANYYIGAGTSRSCAAGRLAYTYGLEGPAITLDTACSSSLVSVHMAVQALRQGECDTAIAAGVNLILSPQGSVVACCSQMLSPSGHCHTFDANADGYVRSEGCGTVLLKPFSRALQDGDQIYALIRGTAVNHDGRSQGLTAPSGQAQRRVIAAALADAGVAPEAVDFVECHGTGTALGDPIEVRAIEASYIKKPHDKGAKIDDDQKDNLTTHKPLIIGALKSNLGHMEAAAGIGGLHKAIQVVRQRKVPKNINFNTLNPQIKVDLNTLRVAGEPLSLEAEGPLYAGVSSFGFSGTNAHVIIESYQGEPSTESNDQGGIFRLAAHSSAALNEYSQRYLALLDHDTPIDLSNLCRTAATGRSEGDFRIAFSVKHREDLRACLEEYIDVIEGDEICSVAKSFPCLWVIGGEVNVDWILARSLYNNRSVYRTAVEDAYEYLHASGHPHKLTDFQHLLDDIEQTTAVLPHAVHRWALAKLLLHMGLSPRRIIGVGVGEYIAASIAGLVNWKDLMDILVSGDVRSDISLGRKRYEFVSTAGKDVLLPQAWLDQPPISDEAEIGSLTAEFSVDCEANEFCEIVLTEGLSFHMTDAPEERVFLWVYGQTNRDPALHLEGFLAQCYMAGYTPRWDQVFEDQPVRRISLPSYPFQRQRVWTEWGYSFDESLPSTVGRPGIEAQQHPSLVMSGEESISHPILHRVFVCPSGVRNFSGELSLLTMPSLSAHIVLGEVVLPASLLIDMIMAVGRWCWPEQPLLVDDLQLLHKRVLGDDPIDMYCHFNPTDATVAIYSKTRGLDKWQQNVRARLTTCPTKPVLPPEMALDAYQAKCDEALSIRHFYQEMALTGLSYGENFQGVFQIYRGVDCALAKIALPPMVDQSLQGFLAHPILLDACLQAISAASRPNINQGVYVPSQIGGVRLYKSLPEILWCLVDVSPIDSSTAQQGTRYASLTLLDSEGECVMSIDQFETIRYEELSGDASEPYVEWIYEKHWQLDESDVSGTNATQSNAQYLDDEPHHWLLFSDQGVMCDALEIELTTRGDRVSVVCLDEPIQPHHHEVSLYGLLDLNDMFNAVEEGTQAVTGVIYAWSLASFNLLGGEHYSDRLAQYTKYPLWLCQAVLTPERRKMALSFLTCGSQPVGQGTLTQPLASLLWGHVTSFINENSVYASLIDLDPSSDNVNNEVALLVKTLQERSECQFGLRGGSRYVARLQTSNLDASREVGIDALGCYLISGGFGALGLETAKVLVSQGARHLILLGRRAGTDGSRVAVQALEDMGAHIYPLAADIADEDDFISKLSVRLKGLPQLKGVIHSAGVLADGVVAQQHWDNYLKVFAAKVAGTLTLYRAVREQPLDFFVFYSSAASILGNPGQANYAAANAFLDSFAWYLKGRGLHATSINWGGWSQIGVAASLEQACVDEKASLLGFIPPQQGVLVIEHLFDSSHSQFAVLPLNREIVLDGDKSPYLQQLLCEVLDSPGSWMQATLAPSPAGQMPIVNVLANLGQVTGEERRTRLKLYLNSVLGAALKRSNILDDRASLFDLGLDSLLGIDVRLRIEKDLGCVLPSTLFHDYSTIETLADYFMDSVVGDGEALVESDVSLPKGSFAQVEQASFDEAKADITSPDDTINRLPHNRLSHPRNLAIEDGDIAIIGLSGRYPDAPDLQTFWDNLREGRDGITQIPTDRWDHDAYFDPRKSVPGKSYSAWGGFIDGIDQFDPEFFNIPLRMAAYMDPKERLFLETVWNLFEEAAYTREKLKQDYGSKVGVFVGAMYQLYGAFAGDIHEQAATALSSYNAIAHRASYFFNLQGPSVALDTMCSSSLTSIHLACQSLYNGDCEMAIAGGINLSLHPIKYVGLSQAQIVGSHSGSRSFSDGDGFLPSEGVGAVLLKPLRSALEAGDRIEAIIKASTINHGGRSTGFYAPNTEAQVQLIEDNFKRANIDPASIQYVEAAANGTSLGDAVEFKALNKVFSNAGVEEASCPIGTVKSNIGHAEAASGMAQLAKVILQLKHQTFVPTIKTEPANPNIQFETSPFYLLDSCQPWPQPEQGARRATISSFGAGGANGHLIIEEFVPVDSALDKASLTTISGDDIIVLSARTQPQLQNVVSRLLAYLDTDSTRTAAAGVQRAWLSNIAHTLQTGREEMDCRLSLLVSSIEVLREGLLQYLNMGSALMGNNHAVPMQVGNIQDQLELRNLLSGTAGEAMAQMLIAEKQLEKLALHWVQGGRVAWKVLRQDQPVHYISLPTYPFSRARYWLSGGEIASTPKEKQESCDDQKEPSGIDA